MKSRAGGTRGRGNKIGFQHSEEMDTFPPPDTNNNAHAEVLNDINFESAKPQTEEKDVTFKQNSDYEAKSSEFEEIRDSEIE